VTGFFRFPHTPHLTWLGRAPPRGDKVMEPHEASQLLAGQIVVEEKVDGANLGFSSEGGTLQAQNRGGYLDLDTPQGQWKPLKRWLQPLRHELAEALTPDLMLFGEWCYAVHSIQYTRLPSYFLAFDVYDRAQGTFWSVDRRNELTRRLGIATVPELGRGRYTLGELKSLLAESRLADVPAEGLYVRRESGGLLSSRAKLVRAEFVQAIEEHWSRRALRTNRLVSRVEGAEGISKE